MPLIDVRPLESIAETQQGRVQGVVKCYDIAFHCELVNCPLQFQKSSQLFIRVHNETLSVMTAIIVGIIRSIARYKPPSPIPEKQSASHPHAQ